MSIKRRIVFLLAGVLSLSGCTGLAGERAVTAPTEAETLAPAPSPAPEELTELWGFPIDDTHDAFEVPTGGRMGTVLVTVEVLHDESICSSVISVWSTDDLTEPIQTMETEGVTTRRRELVDANFDGHMDFSYVWFLGAKNDEYGLYVWDEEQGRFAPEERFLGHLTVDGDNGTIRNYAGGGGGRGTEEIFRWEDGELALARRLEIGYSEDDGVKQILTVEDRVAGERKEYHFDISGEDGDIWEEARLWYDLDYHGEDMETLWGFPIDDTHDAFEVPTGGKLGTVLVTVEMVEGEYEFMAPATLSVWNPNDLSAPIQVIEESGFTHYFELLDANFDGYMDFCYTWSLSATNANYSLLVWDESEKKFADNEEFLGYGLVLDAENKTISNYTHGSAATGIHTIYCWENKKLLEARTVEVSFPSGIFDEPMELIVCDRIDGEMTEVYRETFAMDGETVYQEATKWYDLSYHGE